MAPELEDDAFAAEIADTLMLMGKPVPHEMADRLLAMEAAGFVRLDPLTRAQAQKVLDALRARERR